MDLPDPQTASPSVVCQTLPAGPTKDIFAIHQFDTIALPEAFAQCWKIKGSGESEKRKLCQILPMPVVSLKLMSFLVPVRQQMGDQRLV